MGRRILGWVLIVGGIAGIVLGIIGILPGDANQDINASCFPNCGAHHGLAPFLGLGIAALTFGIIVLALGAGGGLIRSIDEGTAGITNMATLTPVVPSTSSPMAGGGGGLVGDPSVGQGQDVAQGIAAIRAHDPGFDEQSFLSLAERCFRLTFEANRQNDPSIVRPIMEWNHFLAVRSQFDAARQAGAHMVVDGLDVQHCAIGAAESNAAYDTVMVRFDVRYSASEADDKGKVVRGDTLLRPHRTDVYFHRRSNATTRVDGGTMAQKCPNCGASLSSMAEDGTCAFCHQPVTSGDFDWVIVRTENPY